MIKKIETIKQFAIFHDCQWHKDVPDFKRFNLIYGWNRSGKTIFSRIFSACERKSIDFPQYPQTGEFKLERANGSKIAHSDVEDSELQVKVFNQDFVKENLFFDNSDKHCNPIIYISQEDIASKKRLDKLKEERDKLIKCFGQAKQDKKTKENEEDKFRIALALTIKNAIGDLKTQDKYRAYDKENTKQELTKTAIDNFVQLSKKDANKYKATIKTEARNKQNSFPEYVLNFHFNGHQITEFSAINSILQGILSKSVVSETLQRLKDNKELNNWVKQGFDLHRKKEELEKCLFCEKPLDEGFLDTLSRHFSEDYETLQNNINTLTSGLESLRKDKIVRDKDDLYSDLQDDYEQKKETLNNLVDQHNAWLDQTIALLKDKYDDPFSSIEPPPKPQDFKFEYDAIIGDLNQTIISHNRKVENHDQEVRNAKGKLEHHYIAEAIEQQDYGKIKQELDDKISNEATINRELEQNEKSIRELEEKISSIGPAIERINKYLEEFFGRKEIQLELDSTTSGYVIKRDNEVARNLSEGEKTAIAFSYFITKAQERDFDVKEGIIFIDDPISSFDSNFIYHCFSVIKSHFKNSKQLFIATHNFELLNLIKEWFRGKNDRAKRKGKDEVCGFYMIENTVEDNKRHAYLQPMEQTLKNFKSEYHYLFFVLNRFVEKAVPEYADFYTIGNIARRFIEIYTNFKIPTTGDLASKIGQLDTRTVSATEKDKVYRLIQEFSHGGDPTSTIEHKDKRESKDAIGILLKIVEESDPKHFELLRRNL
jgi:wobble nucleotide-excising tRNase